MALWGNEMGRFQIYFGQVLDLLEEAKIQDKEFTDLIGPDVATFIDEMMDDNSWGKKQKINLIRS